MIPVVANISQDTGYSTRTTYHRILDTEASTISTYKHRTQEFPELAKPGTGYRLKDAGAFNQHILVQVKGYMKLQH